MILSHSDPIYNKRVTKASSALVIRLPFFGYLLFGSSVKVVGENIPTMATDGLKLYCGVEFVKAEDFDIVMFGLLHELLHVYFNHAGRRETRHPMIWNIAVDIFVNGECSMLLSPGLGPSGSPIPWKVPDRFIQPQAWATGKTAEEIYEILKKQFDLAADALEKYLPKDASGKPFEGEISTGHDIIEPKGGTPVDSDQDGDGLGPQADAEFQNSFREDISRAKALAERSPLHKELPDTIRSRMDKILKPTLPWGSLVRGQLSQDLGWASQTYCPPKMKYYPIILPQTRTLKERKLLLGVDVSASVTQKLIQIFITNVQSAAMRATEIIIVSFDEIVREVYRTKRPKEIYNHVKFISGAHSFTSAVGMFEIAEKENPSAICVLTDGYIDLPDKVFHNTTFVIPEGGQVQPWGRTYTMEHPWR